MTPMQELFVREYLVDLNATQAAIRAGYSAKTAEQQGPRLLGNVEIAAAVQREMDKRAAKLDISAERVLQEIARLAFFDPSKLFDNTGRPLAIHELDEDTRRAIAGLEVQDKFERSEDGGEGAASTVLKYKLADKGANLERLGRHLKLFTDKLEVSGAVVTVKDYTGRADV